MPSLWPVQPTTLFRFCDYDDRLFSILVYSRTEERCKQASQVGQITTSLPSLCLMQKSVQPKHLISALNNKITMNLEMVGSSCSIYGTRRVLHYGKVVSVENGRTDIKTVQTVPESS